MLKPTYLQHYTIQPFDLGLSRQPLTCGGPFIQKSSISLCPHPDRSKRSKNSSTNQGYRPSNYNLTKLPAPSLEQEFIRQLFTWGKLFNRKISISFPCVGNLTVQKLQRALRSLTILDIQNILLINLCNNLFHQTLNQQHSTCRGLWQREFIEFFYLSESSYSRNAENYRKIWHISTFK